MDERLRDWMERYIRAWGTNGPDEIGSMFTDDARYYTAPWREPWEGRDGIVAGWLERKDDQGDWRFRWEPVVSSDGTHVVRGRTDYVAGPAAGKRFHNLWLIRLDPDGRCTEFTEWWMEEK